MVKSPPHPSPPCLPVPVPTEDGAGLNLSPLARLLRANQLVPLMSAPVFITRKEIFTP